jgi:hypothetical protein
MPEPDNRFKAKRFWCCDASDGVSQLITSLSLKKPLACFRPLQENIPTGLLEP